MPATGMVADTPAVVDITTTPHARVPQREGPRTTAPPLPLTTPQRARLFSPAQPSKANQSVRYAWPQTLTTPESAVQRPFGMVPKQDAARATKGDLSPQRAPPFAATGTTAGAAPSPHTNRDTNALDAATRITELRGALELRRNQALTPYRVDAWESFLLQCNLLVKYPNLISSLRFGFDAGIHPILHTYTPPNSTTLLLHPEAYRDMVSNEFQKGRYISPCSRHEVESLIGPFQSSPLSWVPKAGKPGKYRAVHNFSFPHYPSPLFASINSSINPDMFPCIWGTFATICFTISNLPPGSQAAIRDVAEAYRTIPVIADQWPGLVVKLLDEDEFAINTCDNFGLSSAGGIYGGLRDAMLDIFRAQGIGPSSKWVDDHIFFRFPRKFSPPPLATSTNTFSGEYLTTYNLMRQRWHSTIMLNGGRQQSGSRFWYQGESMPDDSPAEFDEDAAHPMVDFSSLPNCSSIDSQFTYCDVDIDNISEQLGIPWEPSKTVPFSSSVQYLGFDWNLVERTVAITEKKKDKYRSAIKEWLPRATHTLEEAQKLYGKLLHASLVLPAGRAYLTSLEGLMASFNQNPFVPHHAPRHTLADLSWWLDTLNSPRTSHPIPGPANVIDKHAFSDASSGFGIGITIGIKWRAWRLVPGWKADSRDIVWAEAVGFELLARTLCAESKPGQYFRVFGDNKGVVEGWWKGRSRNWETNKVF